MKIAVTGAAGFIGRHVCSLLKKRSVEVTAVVRNPDRLEQIGKPERHAVVDIHDPPPDPYIVLDKPDVLVHLAWEGLSDYTSMKHIEKELPLHYAFLAHLLRSGLPALVVTGTCLEYGLQSGPLGETSDPRPVTPYGYAKNALQRQLAFLHRSLSFAFTWARLFYLYGSGQTGTSLLPQLRSAVQKGMPVFNMSGGEQLRDYMPVEEAATALVDLAIQKADLGPVNVCSGNPVSVRSMIEKWIRENGWNIRLNPGYYPYPDYEPMAFWGNRAKLDTFYRTQ